jgi:hypothetical protein
VLGVDDWSQRRGRTYGTILIDADQRRPIDLLLDRTAASLAGWLVAHPSLEVVTRDRSTAYAEGQRGEHRAPSKWPIGSMCSTISGNPHPDEFRSHPGRLPRDTRVASILRTFFTRRGTG